MGDPHNPKRYGETWPQHRIDKTLEVLETLKPYVVVSGGYAWHFMCPPGHTEYKHGHDHKDVDIYVPRQYVGTVMGILQGLGFKKAWTRYDRLDNPEEFRRYEKHVQEGVYKFFRVTIDFFVETSPIPCIEIDGWKIVEPKTLLSFYEKGHHSSSECFAVQTARKLLQEGTSIIGHPDLARKPESNA